MFFAIKTYKTDLKSSILMTVWIFFPARNSPELDIHFNLNPKFLRLIEILLITAAETKSAAVKQHEEST